MSWVVEGPRDHLARRAHGVGERLLADRGDQDGPLLTVGREVEEMTGNTLADRAEDVARECLKNLIQPPRDLFGEPPGERASCRESHGCSGITWVTTKVLRQRSIITATGASDWASG